MPDTCRGDMGLGTAWAWPSRSLGHGGDDTFAGSLPSQPCTPPAPWLAPPEDTFFTNRLHVSPFLKACNWGT